MKKSLMWYTFQVFNNRISKNELYSQQIFLRCSDVALTTFFIQSYSQEGHENVLYVVF